MEQQPNPESQVWVRGPSTHPLSSTGRQAEARAITPQRADEESKEYHHCALP